MGKIETNLDYSDSLNSEAEYESSLKEPRIEESMQQGNETGSVYSTISSNSTDTKRAKNDVLESEENLVKSQLDFSSFEGLKVRERKNRESFISHLSDYSVKDKDVARKVSIKVIHPDTDTFLDVSNKNQYANNETEGSNKKESGRKLTTQTSTKSMKQIPDLMYTTALEESIPPRSPRRPKSEIVILNNELKAEIEKYKAKAEETKRNSLCLTDNLDELMERANSIALSEVGIKGLTEMESNAQLTNDEVEAESEFEAEAEDAEAAEKIGSRIPSADVDNDIASVSTEDYPHPTIGEHEPLLISHDFNKSELPPRPTPENVRRAREISNYLSENRKSDDEVTNNSKTSLLSPDQDKENDYADKDEPILHEKPARGISVKQSIKNPKNVKHKKAQRKNARGSGQSLMPFSYQTLISLLESTNGTMIGDEFSKLDLPPQEKQMIEKIMDSLSRLTSDMVIDSNRYEVGLQRLDKALRALEGFL